jgi:hypothetical protein
MGSKLDVPIESLNETPPLWTYLESIDVHATKERVYENTVVHFAGQAEQFIHRVENQKASLETIVRECEDFAASYAGQYDPAPGEAVGGLFHEFVQSKRGSIRRMIGSTSAVVIRGATSVGRRVTSMFTTPQSLDPDDAPDATEINNRHRKQIERIVRDLVTHYIDYGRRLGEPVGPPLETAAGKLDLPALEASVGKTALKSDDVSEEFRAHAMRTLDAWWNDHRGQRAALESLDTVLAVMPAGIAVPISIYTGGVGAGEAAAVAGAVAATFVAKVMELQFGDAMFDFLSPWKAEQQELLRDALHKQITSNVLAPVHRMLAPFSEDSLPTLKESIETCRKA